ncbi:uncharacterized protein LOC117119474 [Anneissia japonica]|uniref:uncharacterized protein LOC117119474 n=1 Tax=Anneissia japonica TaxID=1529436 RepID=UPI0014255328|nr:uncharacterized protein LOC117119474 [Anneissia japonica]
MYQCIQCQQPVTQHQGALFCEECERWQHRERDSGVTQAECQRAVRENYIERSCNECAVNDNVQQLPDKLEVYAAGLGPFKKPDSHQEVEINDPYPQPNPENDDEDDQITYTVLEGTSACGKDTLVDSLGYQYTKKVDKRRANTIWRCSLRTKARTCKATVIQKGGEYTPGLHDHICGMMPGRGKVAVIRRNIKLEAMRRPYDSVAEIVDKVLREDIGVEQIELHPTLPKPSCLARQANQKRKLSRRRHPSDLNFEVHEQHTR